MKLRTLTLFAAFTLIGCGDDSGATAVEIDDTATTETTTEDTSVEETTPPADTAGGETAPPADTTPAGDTMTDTPTMTTLMKCGAVTCNSGSQDCCVTAGIGVCTTKGGVCAGARYGCTSKTNCAAGQVCCISGAGTGGASCAAAGACPSTTTCDSNADCSGSAKTCTDIGAGIKACSK